MTDKGMPEEIYVGEGTGFEGNDILIADTEGWSNECMDYIRKDQADELARALDDARANILGLIKSRSSEAEGSDSDWVGDIDDILTRINAIMEGK